MICFLIKIINDPQSITMIFLAICALFYSRARKNKESGIEVRKDLIKDIFILVGKYKADSSYLLTKIHEEQKYNNIKEINVLSQKQQNIEEHFLYTMIGHLTVLNTVGSRKFKKWFFEKQKSSFVNQPWLTSQNMEELLFLMTQELKMSSVFDTVLIYIRKILLIK